MSLVPPLRMKCEALGSRLTFAFRDERRIYNVLVHYSSWFAIRTLRRRWPEGTTQENFAKHIRVDISEMHIVPYRITIVFKATHLREPVVSRASAAIKYVAVDLAISDVL